jgi:hypothetical protein
MSISLTDDNIKWINNHPITRQNIKEHISEILRYSKPNYNEYVIDKIDNLKLSMYSYIDKKYKFRNRKTNE